MPRAALVVADFFLGENRHAATKILIFCFIVARQTAMPIQIVPRDSVQGGMIDSKSYCTVAKTRRDETSQVTVLSPG